jgi:hypothetical protein
LLTADCGSAGPCQLGTRAGNDGNPPLILPVLVPPIVGECCFLARTQEQQRSPKATEHCQQWRKVPRFKYIENHRAAFDCVKSGAHARPLW